MAVPVADRAKTRAVWWVQGIKRPEGSEMRSTAGVAALSTMIRWVLTLVGRNADLNDLSGSGSRIASALMLETNRPPNGRSTGARLRPCRQTRFGQGPPEEDIKALPARRQ